MAAILDSAMGPFVSNLNWSSEMNITTEDQKACALYGCQQTAQTFKLRTRHAPSGHIAAFLHQAALWNNKEPFYWLATTQEISDPAYRADLKEAVAGQNIGEREWLTALADALLKVDMQNGRIWRPMEQYHIPFVDEIIPNDRYMRDFMGSDHCEYSERDKLIDLFFRIFAPDIARRFGN